MEYWIGKVVLALLTLAGGAGIVFLLVAVIFVGAVDCGCYDKQAQGKRLGSNPMPPAGCKPTPPRCPPASHRDGRRKL
jgi:hypothetical protein